MRKTVILIVDQTAWKSISTDWSSGAIQKLLPNSTFKLVYLKNLTTYKKLGFSLVDFIKAMRNNAKKTIPKNCEILNVDDFLKQPLVNEVVINLTTTWLELQSNYWVQIEQQSQIKIGSNAYRLGEMLEYGIKYKFNSTEGESITSIRNGSLSFCQSDLAVRSNFLVVALNLLKQSPTARIEQHSVIKHSEPGKLPRYGFFYLLNLFYQRKYNESLWGVGTAEINEKFELSNIRTYLTGRNKTTLADPFPITHEGKTYIFLEELPADVKNGYISVLTIDGDRKPIHLESGVVKENFHMSYPLIARTADKFYMIPEGHQSNSILLYEATEFPFQWKRVKKIPSSEPILDMTPLNWKGRDYLFYNKKELSKDSPDNKTYVKLLSGDPLEFKGEATSFSPISFDIRNSRQAGSFFEKGDKLHRVSQDGSKKYGYALNINEVELLDEDHYREKLVAKILPEPYGFTAIHTLNFIDKNHIVFDFGFNWKDQEKLIKRYEN